MTIEDYKRIINENKFEEYPYVITGDEQSLSEFINYNETDIDLKIYLCKLIICRCFPTTGGIYWGDNSTWFITNFLETYKVDILKPYMTDTIKEAIEMILSKDVFNKGIIGTTFMFGIVEFYVKYELGFRPDEFNFFDKEKKKYFKDFLKKNKIKSNELGMALAFEMLQTKQLPISNSLNEIDNHNIKRIEIRGIKKGGWILPQIKDKLSLYRNTMLHGEKHSFYAIGQYSIMLFMLFHLHRIKINNCN